MLDKYQTNVKIQELKDSVRVSKDALKVDEKRARIAEIELLQKEEGFWNDVKHANALSKELSGLNRTVGKIDALNSELDGMGELVDMAIELGGEEEEEEIRTRFKELEKTIEELSVAALLRGQYDGNDAILTIHAGAGGTEAQDWADMLYRMYTRFAEREGYKVTVLDILEMEDAGIKSVTMEISGDNVYGYLKAEKGVHRLVRISPFDANKRRHTSFASVEVMPVIEDDGGVVINPDDLRIDTYRSGGKGGQNVNKVSSAIRITHIPTNIVVQCQNERSQLQNKEMAMKMLISKLIELQEREREERDAEIKGAIKKIEWGSQIRSYVFCPYTMVKDHRTGYEVGDVYAVMDGDIEGFIVEYLKMS